MKNNIFFFLLFFSLFFMACEKDIELDLPDQHQLVIFSNFTPDSTFNLRLATTFPIDTSQDRTNTNYPSNANIQLFENGVYVDDFVFQPSVEFGFLIPNYKLNKKPDPTAEYSIQASLPGFPEVKAKNSIPSDFIIDNLKFLDTASVKIEGIPGGKFLQLSARLKINPANLSTGLFHIKAWKNIIDYDVLFPGDTIMFPPYKIGLEVDINNSVEHVKVLHEDGELIDLNNLNSGSDGFDLTILFSYYPQFELKSPIYLEVRQVSEDYYLFHKTVGEQESSNLQESILSSQSILIHSNIENGLGYFGAYNVVQDSILW